MKHFLTYVIVLGSALMLALPATAKNHLTTPETTEPAASEAPAGGADEVIIPVSNPTMAPVTAADDNADAGSSPADNPVGQ